MSGRRSETAARAGALAALALLSQGCFSAGYVAQAARGELGILGSARSIRRVVADRSTPARVKRLVASVHGIKAYGEAQGLLPTRNYTSYADLHRPAAVWVVQACAPLAFEIQRWRFPIVGTIPYLGFFDEAAARRYAASLAAERPLDVDVRGAAAFSTLGWFHDPVLSTMIPRGDAALGQLANAVLHESVHATLYIRDQSAFDESLASFVADRLTPRWLVATLGPDARETRAWVAAHAAHRALVARLHRAYVELDALYRSSETDPRKLAAKEHILGTVREELRWSRPLNNATLADFRTYDAGTEAFERLLAACQGSWPRFLAALRHVHETSFDRPQQVPFDEVVDRLASHGCAP